MYGHVLQEHKGLIWAVLAAPALLLLLPLLSLLGGSKVRAHYLWLSASQLERPLPLLTYR